MRRHSIEGTLYREAGPNEPNVDARLTPARGQQPPVLRDIIHASTPALDSPEFLTSIRLRMFSQCQFLTISGKGWMGGGIPALDHISTGKPSKRFGPFPASQYRFRGRWTSDAAQDNQPSRWPEIGNSIHRTLTHRRKCWHMHSLIQHPVFCSPQPKTFHWLSGRFGLITGGAGFSLVQPELVSGGKRNSTPANRWMAWSSIPAGSAARCGRNSNFSNWFKGRYLVRYPTPPRNRQAITEELAQSHGLFFAVRQHSPTTSA
jgi:hypothetical protein